MRKIMIAAMSLSLLTGTVVFAHQDTSTAPKKVKKKKKTTSTDTAAPKK